MPRPSTALCWLWTALVVSFVPAAATAHPPLHTQLRRSEPARDTALVTPPTRIALWFTARPQIPFSRLELIGPSGEIALPQVVADTGNGFYATVPVRLSAGVYVVRWQAGSADGHPVRGEFTFRVLGDPSAPTVATPSTAQRPAALNQSEYRSARWVEFVALLTVLGALGFRHGVLPPLAARGVATADAADRARRLGLSALVLYAIAALVRLYTESRAIHGTDAFASGVIVHLTTSTTWGWAWSAGVIGAALVFIGWSVSPRTVALGTPLALTGALGMVLSPSMSGHAASSRHFIASVTLDMLHVAAAGVWVGGLVLVLIVGVPAMRRLTDGNPNAAVSALVNSFHPLALFCAPLVVVAGVGTSWIRLGGMEAVTSTQYGRTLLIKVALVLVVMLLGAYNSSRARRRLGTAEATRHFRSTALAELVVAALVLAVTTALVVTPVPSEMGGP